MTRWPEEGETNFLNVDLDIYSNTPLDPIVAAFGEQVSVHYVGRERNRYAAHVSFADSFQKGGDELIGALAGLVRNLPRATRRLWEQTQSREFNIGIQAGLKPRSYELRVETHTLKAVAALRGNIVVTVYAAQSPRKKRVSSRG